MNNLTFPSGFLWGTATAPVQNEGSFHRSTWWLWEQIPGAIRNGDRSTLICNWWSHAEADFDLAQSLGNNTLRLGVEWSRVEPEEGVFDQAALARYRQMLEGLRARGLEPMVTLHHFSDPLWLDERGGWLNRRAPQFFRRFVGRVVEELGDLARLWITINEPMVYVFEGYLAGRRPPGYRNMTGALAAARQLLTAHGAAYRAIHARQGGAQVGIANHLLHFAPADPTSAGDRLGARLLDWLFNGWKLAAQTGGTLRPPFGLGLLPHGPLVDSVDFLGLNYYSRAHVAFSPGRGGEFLAWKLREVGDTVDRGDRGGDGFMGEVYPEGMLQALRRLGSFGKPIFITENGLADRHDRLRPRFLLDHLAQVHRAIAEGIDVRGYYHWTLVDNFEWTDGWQMRFGLVELNLQTGERRLRPSGRLYEQICRANRIVNGQLSMANCQ